MTLSRVEFSVALTVKSPFMFQGLHSPLLGIDVIHLRDEAGLAIIPADQIRGVLRAVAKTLTEEAPKVLDSARWHNLFGPEPNDKTSAQKYKADRHWDLIFSDLVALVAQDCPNKPFETTRIEIDDETGAVETGQLQVIELVAPFGQPVTFKGTAIAFVPEGDIAAIEEALNAALGLLASIGAFKSAGFGEIIGPKLKITMNGSPTVLKAPAAQSNQANPGSQFFKVMFDRPILVDADWIADNAFEGAAVIPGAVFKGALAQRLRRAGIDPEKSDYAQALTHMRVSHAFPAADDGSIGGLFLPLSLVAADGKSGVALGDALDVPDGMGALLEDKAGLFIPDWKYKHCDKAAAFFGTPKCHTPARIVRTHTAIDSDNVAADQMLFTTIARSNLDAALSPRPWLVEIDMSKVADGGKAATLLALLKDGLDGIGKTNARATFNKIDPPIGAASVKPVHGRDGDFALVLRTPALLTDPRDPASARAKYAAYFKKVCPDASLASFFAHQRLAGRYLAHRFRPYGASYYPFLLTEPGSVFLIRASKGQGSKLQDRLEVMLREGLPLPELVGASKLDWKNCPFVPENGYGAFTADYLAEKEHAALRDKVTHA